jgi:3-dehydroquinate synthase
VGEPLEFDFGGHCTRVLFHEQLELAAAAPAGSALFVFDRHTARLFGGAPPGRRLAPGRRAAPGAGPGPRPAPGSRVVLPPGERSKSWGGAEAVLRAALRLGLGRDATIVGVGGGMVCDLAAFGASLYMRGCRLLLVPTSLLAMVDAALGGKTAINLLGYKNAVGTFYPAEELHVWTGALRRLPQRELRSGLAEAIKTALLGDAELLALLRERREGILQRDPGLLEEVVRRCLAVKGRVVAEDFRESGRREILNLGHTFGHALEAATRLRSWTHGEAVAWGLLRAVELGLSLGLTPAAHAAAVRGLLADYGFRLEARPVRPERLLAAMQTDKKRRRGKIRLVLSRGIDDTVVETVDEEAILRCLREG